MKKKIITKIIHVLVDVFHFLHTDNYFKHCFSYRRADDRSAISCYLQRVAYKFWGTKILCTARYSSQIPIRQTSADSSWNDEPDLIFRSKKYDNAIFPVTMKQKKWALFFVCFLFFVLVFFRGGSN